MPAIWRAAAVKADGVVIQSDLPSGSMTASRPIVGKPNPHASAEAVAPMCRSALARESVLSAIEAGQVHRHRGQARSYRFVPQIQKRPGMFGAFAQSVGANLFARRLHWCPVQPLRQQVGSYRKGAFPTPPPHCHAHGCGRGGTGPAWRSGPARRHRSARCPVRPCCPAHGSGRYRPPG